MGERVHVEFRVKRERLFERSLPSHRWAYGMAPPVPVPKVAQKWRLKEEREPATL